MIPVLLAMLYALAVTVLPAAAADRVVYASEDRLYEAYTDGLLTERSYRELVELYRYPVNLNGPDLERLTAVPGIDAAQVEYLYAHRIRHGDFAAPESLAAVAGVDDDLLAPFVYVRRASLPVAGTVRCRLRQDAGRGAEPVVHADAGLRFRDMLELDTRTGAVAGEAADGAFSLTYLGSRYVRRAYAGGYRTSFGHGLVLGGAHRDGGGIRLSGACVELGAGPWNVVALQTSSDLAGYARDDAADSTVLRDLCGALHAGYGRRTGLSVGVTGLVSRVRAYRGHAEHYRLAGCDWRYRYRHLSFIGEAAVTQQGNGAAEGGLAWKKREFATRILYREYAPGFRNPYARSSVSVNGARDGLGERGITVRSDMRLPGAVKVWGAFNTWTVPGTGTWCRDDRIGFRQGYGRRHRWGCGVAFAADDLKVPAYGSVGWWVRNELRPDVLPVLTVKALYRTRKDRSGTTRDGYAWVKAEKTFANGMGLGVRLKVDDNDLDRPGDAWLLAECVERIRTVAYLEVEARTAYTVYEDGRDGALRVTVQGTFRFE